jgi:hypothetical protein
MILVSPPPQYPGPEIPLVRPLPRASVVGSWEPCGIEAFVREFPGAVVVVEDEVLKLNVLPSLRSFLLIRMRLMDAGLPFPPIFDSPIPIWMDPATVRSGGNVVHKIYSLGGVQF